MQNTSQWLEQAKEHLSTQTENKFISVDKNIEIEWLQGVILSPDLANFKKDVSEIAAQQISKNETNFLHSHPEAADSEFLLKPCAPLFKNGLENIDWNMVEKQIQKTVKLFYHADISSFGKAAIKPLMQDIYICVTAKNVRTKELLGFAMFSIAPTLPRGTVKIIHIDIKQKAQDGGLEKLLTSSIFKILPNTKRLFLGTRPTNKNVIENFNSWGFKETANPITDKTHTINQMYFTVLEYIANQCDTLQKAAKELS
ncbi:hypothetical protein KAU11_02420 [Candidatus Babeliales bacterium]|nr:hypothetical protein [Candidatus Babeliales bacterium]